MTPGVFICSTAPCAIAGEACCAKPYARRVRRRANDSEWLEHSAAVKKLGGHNSDYVSHNSLLDRVTHAHTPRKTCSRLMRHDPPRLAQAHRRTTAIVIRLRALSKLEFEGHLSKNGTFMMWPCVKGEFVYRTRLNTIQSQAVDNSYYLKEPRSKGTIKNP